MQLLFIFVFYFSWSSSDDLILHYSGKKRRISAIIATAAAAAAATTTDNNNLHGMKVFSFSCWFDAIVMMVHFYLYIVQMPDLSQLYIYVFVDICASVSMYVCMDVRALSQ